MGQKAEDQGCREGSKGVWAHGTTTGSTDSPLGGCLSRSLSIPAVPWRSVKTWRWPLCLRLMPSLLALGQSLLGTIPRSTGGRDKKTESRKRGPLSKPPVTTQSSGQGQAEEPARAPSLRPSLPHEECVLGGSPAWWWTSAHRGGCVLPPIPSEAPIVRLGMGGRGQAGSMSQRPNVLRGGEAEGPPPPEGLAPGHLALLCLPAGSPEWVGRKEGIPGSGTAISAPSAFACLVLSYSPSPADRLEGTQNRQANQQASRWVKY